MILSASSDISSSPEALSDGRWQARLRIDGHLTWESCSHRHQSPEAAQACVRSVVRRWESIRQSLISCEQVRPDLWEVRYSPHRCLPQGTYSAVRIMMAEGG